MSVAGIQRSRHRRRRRERPALSELDWPTLLASREGWLYNAVTGELLCEDGRVLTLTTVRNSPRARATTSVIFRRPWGGCEQCLVREGCLHTEREGSPKHVEFAIYRTGRPEIRDTLGATHGSHFLVDERGPAGAKHYFTVRNRSMTQWVARAWNEVTSRAHYPFTRRRYAITPAGSRPRIDPLCTASTPSSSPA